MEDRFDDELKKDEARQAQLIAEQKAKQRKIDAAESEIAGLAQEINRKENKVTDTKKKIKQLESDIKDKQKEIDNLLSFLQVSNGENIYLEYVFEAKSFSDFIYRSAVIEQLAQYNDELIDDMYEKIENNKLLQVQLNQEINSSEKAIDNLEKV